MNICTTSLIKNMTGVFFWRSEVAVFSLFHHHPRKLDKRKNLLYLSGLKSSDSSPLKIFAISLFFIFLSAYVITSVFFIKSIQPILWCEYLIKTNIFVKDLSIPPYFISKNASIYRLISQCFGYTNFQSIW